eukprot:403348417
MDSNIYQSDHQDDQSYNDNYFNANLHQLDDDIGNNNNGGGDGMMEIDLSHNDNTDKHLNYFNQVNDGDDNIFESKKNLHDNRSRTAAQHQLIMDASKDDEVNKRVEGVLKSFKHQAENDDGDANINKNAYNQKQSIKNNKQNAKYNKHSNNKLAQTIDNQHNQQDDNGYGDNNNNTIQVDQSNNQLRVMYESQDVEARNNYTQNTINNNDYDIGNDAKLKMNQNIDMKMFKKEQIGAKKQLKNKFKGINMQDTTDKDNDGDNGNRANGMDDTYQPPKKGKNKKDREQEIVIDGNDNEEDDVNDRQDDAVSGIIDQQNDDSVKSAANLGGIEFYNRSPKVGYETNDDQTKQQNQPQAFDQNNLLERDEQDQDLKEEVEISSGAKKGKKLNKNKILKNKANQEYLEQLKTMNNISSASIVNKSNNNEYNDNDEPDDYTKEYLRQKKNNPKKSTRRFGATLQSNMDNDPNSVSEQYGLKQVKVAQVLETTRQTQRTQRNLESTISQRNAKQDQNQDDMNKSLGKTMMGTITNKFSIAEVEYRDQDPNNSRHDSSQIGGQDSAILKQNDIGGGAEFEIKEISYKEKLRLMRLKKQAKGSVKNDSEEDDREEIQLQDSNQLQFDQSDDNRNLKSYQAMKHLQLPQLQEDLLENQVNNSYVITNENQRILDTHEREDDEQRVSDLFNDPRSSQVRLNKNFQDVNLNQPLEMSLNNSRKSSHRSNTEGSQVNGNSQQFDKLHYNLSSAINEAKLNETQMSSTIVPFRKEQFKSMILNTYDDWYSDISIRWDINDYLEVVDKSQLEHHFGKYLELNGLNLLTLQNMPFVDLGQRPQSFNPKKPEAEQIYVIPSSVFPNKLIIKYADCKPLFGLNGIADKYKKCNLEDKGVTLEDLQNSIMNASIYLRAYRGAVTRLDRINLINILVGLAVTIALSMSIGITIHWAFSLIFIVIYFFFAFISIKITKRKSNRYLRQAHFMLAVYCRSENNRFFMRKNIEMRPGFLGRWIEFNIYNPKEQQLEIYSEQADHENPSSDLKNVQDGPGLNQDVSSPEFLEKMRERWEKQKDMKQINLFAGRKQPPIPIKDIQQYKTDQQLAMLLQEQESEKYGDQYNYDQDEEAKGHKDFESVNQYQSKDNLRRILPPVKQMGGTLDNINEDEIYSGLYEGQKSKNSRPVLPIVVARGGSSKNQQQFHSPDNRRFQNDQYGGHGDEEDYEEENQSVQSSMKKLTRSYYNMAAVPVQQNSNLNSRKGSNTINPLTRQQKNSGVYNDYGEEIKEEDENYDNDFQGKDDDYYEEDDDDRNYQNAPQQQQNYQNDNDYDNEEEDKQVEDKIYRQPTNPQNVPNQADKNSRQSLQSNNQFLNNNKSQQKSGIQASNIAAVATNSTSLGKTNFPPRHTKKFQEESYHQDDHNESLDDDEDY